MACLGRYALRAQIDPTRIVHFARRRTARQIAFDSRQARFGVALAPATDLRPPQIQRNRDGLVLHALVRQQDDAYTLRQTYTGALGARELYQHAPLLRRQMNFRRNPHSSRQVDDSTTRNRPPQISLTKNDSLH